MLVRAGVRLNSKKASPEPADPDDPRIIMESIQHGFFLKTGLNRQARCFRGRLDSLIGSSKNEGPISRIVNSGGRTIRVKTKPS